MMDTVEILEKARELISDESRWTKEAMARDKSGEVVNVTDQSASCWCSVGAIDKVAGGRAPSRVFTALRAATGYSLIWSFNDTHTHTEVLAAFDRAIADAREE